MGNERQGAAGADAVEAGYHRRLALVNAGLEAVLPGESLEPRRLHRAMRHAVFAGGGGKRLRPVILLTVASDLGVREDIALPAAMALELVHNYSLVHDDLPCMDDAAVRRGAPSVHSAFGYADAVLVGDALLTLAFEVLGRAGNSGLPRPGDLAVELALAAGSLGMVGGQHADLDRTGQVARALPGGQDHPILKVHLLKTARFFSFAFLAPGYLAAERQVAPLVEQLRAAGESFGLAFQVADDIRDSSQDSRAPNFARAVGLGEARKTALDCVSRCLAGLGAALGDRARTPHLVREAVREMGL